MGALPGGEQLKLFVGLGNPGAKYAGNRHNVGYRAVEKIAENYGFGRWRTKFQGLFSEGRIGSERVGLLKPETFMNNSGQSVGEAARYFKLDCGDLIVIHDDIDLAPGKVKAKTGGGTGGHNGLKSVQRHLGGEFLRVRIGVGHPGRKDLVIPHVLKDFSKSDLEWLESALDRIGRGAEWLAANDLQKFQQLVAQKSLSLTKPSPQEFNMRREDPPERKADDGNRLESGVFERLRSWLRG